MSKYNITMKQKNDFDYDELYPESLDTLNTKEDIDNVDYDMDIL